MSVLWGSQVLWGLQREAWDLREGGCRERGLAFWTGSRHSQDNGPHSTFRTTELSSAWSVSGLKVCGEF
ncbi:glycerophosphodiester phosphodiesterase domain-containing protein 5-like isoform X3 [Arapaima gigas]